MSNLVNQFRELSNGRQIALVATAVVSLAFFLWLGIGASSNDYRLLFRGLDEDQAVKVVDGLGAEKIPYRIEEGGTAIYVPGALVYEARIRIAGRGLPGGGSGFEIFDDAGFGVTDFVQKVNYARALQGELARSIEQLEPVERARVQVVMPERSGFMRREERRASASVVVRMRPGRDLDEGQIEGMIHLVASAIPHLTAKDVTIVDTQGRMLAPLTDGTAGPRAPAGAVAQQKRIETELSERVESLLERTVGMGRVVARVHAKLDWTQSEHTEERYDPDSQVARSEQRSTESESDSEGLAAGVPGVRANQPEGIGAENGTAQRSARNSTETINYEISKVSTHRVDPVGAISRLDVAVLVDGKPGASPGAGGGDAAGGAAFTPWSEQELQQFVDLTKRAVGFSAERGDEITVTSAPFRSIEIEPMGGFQVDPKWIALLTTLLNYLGLVLVVTLFARLLARPLLEQLAANSSPRAAAQLATGADGSPLTAGELEAALASGGSASGMQFSSGFNENAIPTLAEQVGMITGARSEDSVKTLRGWLDQ